MFTDTSFRRFWRSDHIGDASEFGKRRSDHLRSRAISRSVPKPQRHHTRRNRATRRGTLHAVRPCNDETLLDSGINGRPPRRSRDDPEAIEAREDFIVRTLLESGPVSVVILGGSHDLAKNVERLSGGKAEYLRVELEAWEKVADRD